MTATAKPHGSPGSGRTDRRGTDGLVKDLLTGEIQHASIVGLAMRYLMAGMPDGQAVLTLRGFMEAIPEDRRSTAAEANRWQARYDDIPRAVRTARAKLGRQSAASGSASTSHGPTVNGRPVADFERRSADTGPMPGQDNAPADGEPARDRDAGGTANASAGEHSGQSTEDPVRMYEHFGAGADGEPIEFSDEALALEFTERHAEHLRFVPGWGKWLEWDGTRWAPDEINRVFMHARTLCRAASERANEEIEDEKSAAKIASKVASRGVVTSVVKLAEADPRHARAAAIWDADPWALNTPGGIVDLRTGTLNRHDPRAHCTKLTAVAPAGECPQWLNFLDEVTGHDPELQAYLRRIAGYFLTGSVKEHALFFIHGPGGNGKGVFINTITDISGDYATVASMETFTASQTDRHPTDMAMLRGARLVTAQETEEGRCWAESKIKALTGGDPVTARFMRQDFFTYQPTFKLVIVGNHRPGIRNVDDAMRRRLHLIPFTYKPPRPDKDLPERLKAERPGILAWAVQGCLEWQRVGLAPPASITNATAEYLADEDAVGLWLSERCMIAPYATSTTNDLFANWRAWAEAAGEHVGSMKRLAQVLIQRGL